MSRKFHIRLCYCNKHKNAFEGHNFGHKAAPICRAKEEKAKIFFSSGLNAKGLSRELLLFEDVCVQNLSSVSRLLSVSFYDEKYAFPCIEDALMR